MENSKKEPTTIRELFPMLPEDQLQAVADTLYRYCEIVLRISDRLEREEQGRIDASRKPS